MAATCCCRWSGAAAVGRAFPVLLCAVATAVAGGGRVLAVVALVQVEPEVDGMAALRLEQQAGNVLLPSRNLRQGTGAVGSGREEQQAGNALQLYGDLVWVRRRKVRMQHKV